MHWIKEKYIPVLKNLLSQFIEAKKEACVAVIALAAEQIGALAKENDYDVPELLERVSYCPSSPCLLTGHFHRKLKIGFTTTVLTKRRRCLPIELIFTLEIPGHCKRLSNIP